MDTSLGKIMSHVYELEGLLLVIEKHAEDTPDFVLTMLRGKARELADEVQLYKLPEKEEPAPAPAPNEPQVAQPVAEEAAAVAEETPQETAHPIEDYDSEDTRQHDEGESLNEVFSSDYVEPEHRTPTVAETPEAESDDEAYADDEDKASVATPPAMPKISLNDNGGELRVDEKLQRTLSKDLHKAFSLNDRYRFRRELFSNSELDWNDALNMVASMSTYEEAEDYFYNDLGWDKNSEEVADFMNVIKNHFS